MAAELAALRGLPRIEDLGDLRGRRVLVRTDFNVPLVARPDGSMSVADDFRITSSLPTLRTLRDKGATIVCCSHLGRPSGPDDNACSMAPVRERLAELFAEATLLENLRFDPGEEANDPAFVARLVEGFDAYVNDAFGVAHRAHGSVVGPPATLPSAAGLLLAREVEVLSSLLEAPARPFVAVLGGAKVRDKIGVVGSVAKVADAVLVGGAMAFSFLAAMGRSVGASLVDPTMVASCAALLDSGAPVELPSDVVALQPGHRFGPGVTDGTVEVFDGDLPDGWVGLDIGPTTAAAYAARLESAATILWNGPMGAFEDARFAAGTTTVATATAGSPAFSVVGGGDSAMALDRLGLADRVGFVSTGGGASLELLEHGDLPALVALRGAPNAPARR